MVPIVGEIYYGNNLAISGTSVLILVAVALDTLRKIESRALMVTYNQYDGGDFFQNADEDQAKKRLQFLRRRPKSKKNK